MIFERRHRSTVGRTFSLVLALAFALRLNAGVVTLNFEGFSDSTILSNQYSGVTFTNTIVLTAGISLNEFEFPPHSGKNVVSDNGGPVTITFATPIDNFSAYFTYAEPLTLRAFGSTNSLLETGASSSSDNEALSGMAGTAPNEFETLTSLSGISRITITGDPLGGSFVMDDMSYSTNTSSVPEPSGTFLTLIALTLVGYLARTRITGHSQPAQQGDH